MAQILSRLFTSSTNAAAAVKDLGDHRFGDNEVFTIDAAAGSSRDDLVSQIAQAGIVKSDAAVYADKVQAGSTLVVVHAPFGSARKATVLLDRHQPLPAVVAAAPMPRPMRYEKAAPASSIFQWPTLSSDPTPVSSFFRWPTISNFSLSRSRGFAELADDAAPLSKKLNWSLLSESAGPLSQKMKWRLLSDDAAPLSQRMNWGTLSSNPAPLSSMLGIQVLSRGR